MSVNRYLMTLTGLAEILRRRPRMLARDYEQLDGLPLVGKSLDPATVRQVLKNVGVDYGFRSIAHVNLRGGIGKTTAAITLAWRAASYGFKTCLLDLDPQGSATLALGVTPDDDAATFIDIWNDPDELLEEALVPVKDHLTLLPSALENSLLDSAMARPAAQKQAVAATLKRLRELGYDLVVIDCPPSLGAAVISSVCAVDTVVVPVWSDPFSIKGLELARQEISQICETFGLQSPEVKVLYSRYDRREAISDKTLEQLRGRFREALLPLRIRVSSEFSKALAEGRTVFEARRKNGAADDYDAYVRHILHIDSAL